MSVWLRFVLAVLATWRITHLLASEDGPADLVVRFRMALGESWAGKLLDCFYCLSVWIAAPAALFVSRNPVEWIFSWLALSGGACLLERATREAAAVEAMPSAEQGDLDDVLRTETVVDTEHFDATDAGSDGGREAGAAVTDGASGERNSRDAFSDAASGRSRSGPNLAA